MNNELNHWGLGQELQNHKYYKRIPTGNRNDPYKYFYNESQYRAYQMGKSAKDTFDKKITGDYYGKKARQQRTIANIHKRMYANDQKQLLDSKYGDSRYTESEIRSIKRASSYDRQKMGQYDRSASFYETMQSKAVIPKIQNGAKKVTDAISKYVDRNITGESLLAEYRKLNTTSRSLKDIYGKKYEGDSEEYEKRRLHQLNIAAIKDNEKNNIEKKYDTSTVNGKLYNGKIAIVKALRRLTK